MAFSEEAAARIRRTLAGREGVAERKMFGGLAFLVRGHMCCGVIGDRLMVRVGPDAYEKALRRPHAREMDFTGRPMRGMVYVDPGGFASPQALQEWVESGLRFAASLPPR
jgi:TfoX/Sxy family transcriptional regulator of competence genes